MILLSVKSVTKHFGPEPVLDGVSFDVRPGERIGLVGPNGAGKSTLLKIIAGHVEADTGSVHLHASATLGYLEQQPDFEPDRGVWDITRDALRDLVALAEDAEAAAAAMSAAADEQQRRKLAKRFDELHHQLQHRDGYHLDHKIETILQGLGFHAQTFRQPVGQLSGGQQNRLLLAQLLLSQPDLILLDEPSNHLDLEGTQWLEDFLSTTRQAMIVVSHDRYFLDKVTGRTLELFHGSVDSFAGNFSAYWRQKAERVEVQRKAYERQQEEIAKLKDFIRRNHYGQKHAQAEDRRKKLERIEPLPPPRSIAAPPMGFPKVRRSGDVVLRVEHLSKRYDRWLFQDLSFQIQRGQRWGILGGNGTGKTTLLRCLLGQESPDEGQAILGTGVHPAYFDQKLSCLAGEAEAVDAIAPTDRDFGLHQRRDLLARFGLTADTALQRVDRLSGGERNRAALARLAASEANFLVLDEPTNHLDLWALDALERSLKKFAGSVLFVTHDRFFINRVADHLIVVESDRFRIIDGNYDVYLHLVKQGLAGQSDATEPRGSAVGATDPGEKIRHASTKGKPTTRRKRRFPYRKLEDLEAEIFEREAHIEQLHEQLTSLEILRDGTRVKQIQSEIETHRQALAVLYEHWESGEAAC